MDDGRQERLAGPELGADRLAHGYVVTVHRSQASTVDVAHRLEDGGGRALAYVSMSRARETNTVHVVADDRDQAVEDLARDWAVDRRARWAIDSGTPATQPLDVERAQTVPSALPEALRLARLQAQRQAVAAAIPPDRSAELGQVNRRLAELRQNQTDLSPGLAHYPRTPAGEAARRLTDAQAQHREAKRYAETSDSWRNRRLWRKEAVTWAAREADAQATYDEVAGPEIDRLDQTIGRLEQEPGELHAARNERRAWLEEHPEATVRLHTLDGELNPVIDHAEIQQALGAVRGPTQEPDLSAGRSLPDHGIDLGL
jgi:hypothetical protein